MQEGCMGGWSKGVDNVQTFCVYQRERQARLKHTPICVKICSSHCKSWVYCSASPHRPTTFLSPWTVSSLLSLPPSSGFLCSCLLRCLRLTDSTQNEIRSMLLCQTGTSFVTHLRFHSISPCCSQHLNSFFLSPLFICYTFSVLVFVSIINGSITTFSVFHSYNAREM